MIFKKLVLVRKNNRRIITIDRIIRLSVDFWLTLETFGLFCAIWGFYEAVHGTWTNGKGDVWATFQRSFGSLGLLLTGVGGG